MDRSGTFVFTLDCNASFMLTSILVHLAPVVALNCSFLVVHTAHIEYASFIFGSHSALPQDLK